MSIIYDALKKVETFHTNDTKTKIDKGFKFNLKIYLVFALTVCLGLFVANILYEWLTPKPSSKTADIVAEGQLPADKKEPYLASSPPTATLQKPPPVETKMETQKESLPSLTLNGVFFSGEEGYALINNRIVKMGDKIDGATVVQISLDEVDVEFGGSVIKLSDSTR